MRTPTALRLRTGRVLDLLTTLLLLAAFTLPSAPAAATAYLAAAPVQTSETSRWNPPSPDPSGITYWPRRDHLVVVDGEVEEMAIWAGANMFEATRDGSLVQTYDTTSFNTEPVGIDIEITENDRFFISNDSKKTIFEIDLGPDREFGTSDDKRRPFLTSGFGNTDPEGLTLGRGKLYTVDGGDRRVYITEPGSNGIFEGSDATTSFDVEGLGVRDPEGIDYDPRTGNLWVVDRGGARLNEITTAGALLQVIDLEALVGAIHPADVTLAPASTGTGDLHLYLVERGIDNNVDPNENDGKIYEIALDGSPPPPSGNLLANASFEDDVTNDGKPDRWGTNRKFTRSTALPSAAGSYVGQFLTTDNSGANTSQTVVASAGTTYTFACSVNIPPQNDTTAFSVKFQARWRNVNNNTISTWTLATLTAHTDSTWQRLTGSKVAPSGTTNAQIRIIVSSLNGAVYVDACSFGS
ncbi:MAG TPA: SdiA-regulated domain-containing protein [Herpetosiphonaceae bacterium]